MGREIQLNVCIALQYTFNAAFPNWRVELKIFQFDSIWLKKYPKIERNFRDSVEDCKDETEKCPVYWHLAFESERGTKKSWNKEYIAMPDFTNGQSFIAHGEGDSKIQTKNDANKITRDNIHWKRCAMEKKWVQTKTQKQQR